MYREFQSFSSPENLARQFHPVLESRFPYVARSSRGLGRWPLTPVTRVRIPYGLPFSDFSQQLAMPPHCRVRTPTSGAVRLAHHLGRSRPWHAAP